MDDQPKPRYEVVPPSPGGESGYAIEDRRGAGGGRRRRVATIWNGGPGNLPPHRIAVRLARWLNDLAAIDDENERIRREGV